MAVRPRAGRREGRTTDMLVVCNVKTHIGLFRMWTAFTFNHSAHSVKPIEGQAYVWLVINHFVASNRNQNEYRKKKGGRSHQVKAITVLQIWKLLWHGIFEALIINLVITSRCYESEETVHVLIFFSNFSLPTEVDVCERRHWKLRRALDF